MIPTSPTPDDYPRHPPSEWGLPALNILCILSVLLPRGIQRLSFGIVLIFCVFSFIFWSAEQTQMAYSTSFFTALTLCRWFDLVAFHGPEGHIWRVEEVEDKPGLKAAVHAPEASWAKVKWFFGAWVAVRGVGYNFVNPKVPSIPSKETTKSSYLFTNSIRIIRLYFAVDIGQVIFRHLIQSLDNHGFLSISLLSQVLFVSVAATHTYSSLEFFYLLLAIPCIALGISQPSEWPDFTGSFINDGYTVRKIWGTCWHQMLRRPCSQAGVALTRFLRLEKGSFASKYTQLWVAFVVSVSFHHLGAITGNFEDGGYHQACFFLLQPVGIMFEDFVIWYCARLGLRESTLTKRVGYLWVFAWFLWSLRFFIASLPESWMDKYAFPSLVDNLF
ncbi:membrane bound O-acyl transferase family-domain-containing protein [Rutstroemia sp. NJR-2017a BVV2]|nr:membrane bound O-acyl transferase family-domain-containing protein [Rutstroemia sp. NJR-2017a BVV2]